MPRPVVQHDGFLIPNASTVSNPRMAEPDRIDFNTMAHALWGVIEGCEVTVSGATASITGGIVVVNGMLVPVIQSNVSLGIGGAQDRFDLIAVDQGGTVKVIIGLYSNDPVFPDPPKDVTVLAAVFAPATQSNFSDNVIDKRKFLQKQLLTKLDPGEMLIRNANGSGNHYSVTGGGLTSWLGDTALWRSAPSTLRVQSKLVVDDSLTVGGEFKADSLTTKGRVLGLNLYSGTEAPSWAWTEGAIFQNETNGKIFIRRNNDWEELATVSTTIPVGTVITSLEKPEVMASKGWVALNGQTITEATHPRLFTIDTLLRFVTAGTEENHDRVMNLPDLSGVLPVVGFANVGTTTRPTAPNGQPRANNQVSLTTANMPRHRHNITSAAGGAGSASGTVGRSGEISIQTENDPAVWGWGQHTHEIRDPGHSHHGLRRHPGTDFSNETIESGPGGVGWAIGTDWIGTGRIAGAIADGSHAYSVGDWPWTGRAVTGCYTLGGHGGHTHGPSSGGDHGHDLRLDLNSFVHNHDVAEQDVGANVAFDVSPVSFVLYAYVRS